jgi:Na+/H+ antiporter NhaD/arsenite permease-like protein
MNNLPVGLKSGAAIRYAQELRRKNLEITPWEFFKIGVFSMPAALIASLLVLWN